MILNSDETKYQKNCPFPFIKRFPSCYFYYYYCGCYELSLFFKLTVEDKAYAIAEVVKAGLTVHMKMDSMDQRNYFLDELSCVSEIQNLKGIRSKSVEKQYGLSKETPERMSKELQSLLDEEKALFVWKDFENRVDVSIPS